MFMLLIGFFGSLASAYVLCRKWVLLYWKDLSQHFQKYRSMNVCCTSVVLLCNSIQGPVWKAKSLTAHSEEGLTASVFQLWAWTELLLLQGLSGFKLFQQELKGSLRKWSSFISSLVLIEGEFISGRTRILQGIKRPESIPLLPANIWNHYQAVNMCLDPFHNLLTIKNWLPVSSVINAEAFKYSCIVLNVFQICSFEVCFKTEPLYWARTLFRISLRHFDKLQRRSAVASQSWSASSVLLNLCVKFNNTTPNSWDLNFTANWKTKARFVLSWCFFLKKLDNFWLVLTWPEDYASKLCEICKFLGMFFFSPHIWNEAAALWHLWFLSKESVQFLSTDFCVVTFKIIHIQKGKEKWLDVKSGIV